MKDLERKVKDYIRQTGLPTAPCRLIVALSGGADSVALLAVLDTLGYDCTAAHCNFHLRGDESVRDMHHAEAVTAALGVDLCVKDFDVAARRAQTGESVEMAARSLRYEWFDELIDRLGAVAVAVGHHREDSVETFFINLLRGSGVNGLAGIAPRQGNVMRPLLECSRAEIEDYLRSRSLTWVDDSSNAGDEYLRNRVRHHLLPALEAVRADALDGVLRSMAILAENKALYRRAVDSAAERYRDTSTGDIDLRALGADADAPLLLYEMLRPEGYSRRATDDMLQAAANSGGTFIAGTTRRSLDHGILRGARAATAAARDCVDVDMLHDILEPLHIEITRHDVREFKPECNRRVIYIDERALEGAPRWQLRPWHRGDRLEPYGLAGSQLVSDIMAGARLQAAQKSAMRLLWRDDRLLWVVGLRASRHYTIGPGTRRYLRLEYKP